MQLEVYSVKRGYKNAPIVRLGRAHGYSMMSYRDKISLMEWAEDPSRKIGDEWKSLSIYHDGSAAGEHCNRFRVAKL